MYADQHLETVGLTFWLLTFTRYVPISSQISCARVSVVNVELFTIVDANCIVGFKLVFWSH